MFGTHNGRGEIIAAPFRLIIGITLKENDDKPAGCMTGVFATSDRKKNYRQKIIDLIFEYLVIAILILSLVIGFQSATIDNSLSEDIAKLNLNCYITLGIMFLISLLPTWIKLIIYYKNKKFRKAVITYTMVLLLVNISLALLVTCFTKLI